MSTNTKKKVTKVATTDRVATALGHIQAAVAAMALTTPKLTKRQKQIAAKARKGSEKVIPTISLLANQLGVNLPLQPTSTMTAQVALAHELEPLQKALQAFLASVEGNTFQANSGSWETATTLYGILKKVAKADPEVRTQLAPVQEFFAYRTPTARAANPKGKKAKAARALQKEQGAAEAAASTQQPGASSVSGSTTSAASDGGSAAAGATGHA
jgi:hypothetical protein